MEVSDSILIADPAANYCSCVEERLGRKYRILSATTVDEAVSILNDGEIELLILDDSLLPCEAVFDILRQRRPIVTILTGILGDTISLLDAFNTGCIHSFLKKPWQCSQFKEIVERAIEINHRRREAQQRILEQNAVINEMKFLHRISQQISEKKPLPQLLKEIMESSKKLMNAEASSLLLYDSKSRKLVFDVATGSKKEHFKRVKLDLDKGIAGWVATHKQPLRIEDCYQDERFNPEYDRQSNFRTRSMIAVPLVRKNRLLGVMQVINKKGGGVFRETDLSLFETLASQCAIAIENNSLVQKQVESEALERELDVAREIQQRLLPQELPGYTDIEVAAVSIPAKQVGGDFYNIQRVDEHQSLLFVADVAGKGIPAALIVSTINACMLYYLNSLRAEFDLSGFVTAMNRVLIESTTDAKYATCWFGLFNHTTRALTSLNAGHNPPYIFRDDSPEPLQLTEGGLFLGNMEYPFSQETIEMRPDDVLVFFSDGVTEAWNSKEDEYGEERLIRTILPQTKKSASEILQIIKKDVRRHVGRARQSDDFTCAVMKVK